MKNLVGSRPIAICVARAPGQKRSNSASLGSTASHPKAMLCVGGAGTGLGTVAVGDNTKGESQPHCRTLTRPPTALVHAPPQSGPPTWRKGSVAASSTLQRVLPREVTHARPSSHIPLLRAEDGWQRVQLHLLVNIRTPGPRGQGLVSSQPRPGFVFSRRQTT